MPKPSIFRVALPGPLRKLFDYLPPAGSSRDPPPGTRVRVPFGHGRRCGIVMRRVGQSDIPYRQLKPIEAVIDQTPLLTGEDLDFLTWTADYYQHPHGDVIFHALPVRLRKGRHPGQSEPKAWRLSAAGAAIDPARLPRAPRQTAILHTLRAYPQGLSQTRLLEQHGTCAEVLRRLQRKAWIEPCVLATDIDRSDAPAAAPSLSAAQQSAVDHLAARLDGFSPCLLDGVTGSGKTEVYLALIGRVLARQRQVLVLVPEIGLTPQLVRRFQRRLGLRVALLHSALSERERERAWLAARNGRAEILLGTRSAVFTPLPRLGLVIVDEEHDLSYKQQEGFRYSARDLAVVRAHRHGCPVLLGSATPSLESLHNVRLGRYLHLRLPERAGSASLPRMDLIDIRSSRLDGGLSPALLKQIKQSLAQGEQVMLFLNRRGYAPVVTCHACGWLSDCPRCDARLTLHLHRRMLWCHHCGHQQRLPEVCPACGSPDLRPLGQGTERLESALQSHFPATSMARIDRDTTSRKGDLQRLLGEIRAGRYTLLIGTQMLAKGHHFPNVTLVGLIDVDQGLFGADYRSSERMAQLIVQVAGRAGRAEKPGRVLIQTRHPEHPLLQILIHRGYAMFAETALREREQAELPPFTHQVLVRAEAVKAQQPMDFLTAAMAAGQGLPHSEGLEFWGPVPAPMERRAGKIRAHLLIQAGDRTRLQRWLSRWAAALGDLPEAKRVRWSLDVDPQEML